MKARHTALGARVLATARRVRIARGMTQTQWAQALTAAGYETNRAGVVNHELRTAVVLGIDEAAAIATVMGCTLDGLVKLALEDHCETCGNEPPPGFSCQGCGASGHPRPTSPGRKQ